MPASFSPLFSSNTAKLRFYFENTKKKEGKLLGMSEIFCTFAKALLLY